MENGREKDIKQSMDILVEQCDSFLKFFTAIEERSQDFDNVELEKKAYEQWLVVKSLLGNLCAVFPEPKRSDVEEHQAEMNLKMEEMGEIIHGSHADLTDERNQFTLKEVAMLIPHLTLKLLVSVKAAAAEIVSLRHSDELEKSELESSDTENHDGDSIIEDGHSASHNMLAIEASLNSLRNMEDEMAALAISSEGETSSNHSGGKSSEEGDRGSDLMLVNSFQELQSALNLSSSSLKKMELEKPFRLESITTVDLEDNFNVCMKQVYTKLCHDLKYYSHLTELNESFMKSLDKNIPFVVCLPANDMFEPFAVDIIGDVLIGRGSSQFSYKSQVVSREHIRFFYESDKFYVKDVGSNSGTFLNGKRLCDLGHSSGKFEIGNGDFLQLGMDYKKSADTQGNLEPRYKAIQMLLMVNTFAKNFNADRDELVGSQTAEDSAESSVAIESLQKKRAAIEKQLSEQHSKLDLKIQKMIEQQAERSSHPFSVSFEYSSILRKIAPQKALVVGENSDGLRFDFKTWNGKQKKIIVSVDSSEEVSYEVSQDETLKNLFHVTAEKKQMAVIEVISNLKSITKPSFVSEQYSAYLEELNKLRTKQESANRTLIPQLSTSSFHSESTQSSQRCNPPQLCLTGNFETGKTIAVLKQLSTREQKLIGGSDEKVILKNGALKKLFSIQAKFEDFGYNDLLLISVVVSMASYVHFE